MKAVLLLCVYLFLNFPVTSSSIFGCLCCGKKQEKNALQNLLGKGTKETWLLVLTECWESPDDEASTWIGLKEDGERYKVKNSQDIYKQLGTIGTQVIPKDSCRVGLDNSRNNVIHVIPNNLQDKDFKECPSNGRDKFKFQSFFLLFKEDMNTFMFLDPTKAKWFFTSDLAGCDVFVAIDPTKPDNPLVIHSNMNSIANEIQNLKHKSETVDKIMTFFPSYQLKARVYRKGDSPDVSIYMKTYEETHNIQNKNNKAYDMKLLESDFYFFGYYTNSKWHFYTKAQKGGDTDLVL